MSSIKRYIAVAAIAVVSVAAMAPAAGAVVPRRQHRPAAAGAGQFKTLLKLAKQAGRSAVARAAPPNGLREGAQGDAGGAGHNRKELRAVLLYHVLKGRITAAKLVKLRSVKTLSWYPEGAREERRRHGRRSSRDQDEHRRLERALSTPSTASSSPTDRMTSSLLDTALDLSVIGGYTNLAVGQPDSQPWLEAAAADGGPGGVDHRRDFGPRARGGGRLRQTWRRRSGWPPATANAARPPGPTGTLERQGDADVRVEPLRLAGEALREAVHRLRRPDSSTRTSASPWRSRILARAVSPRSRLRAASDTAPSLAKPPAAASPRPEVAPVINTTWPSILAAAASSHGCESGIRRWCNRRSPRGRARYRAASWSSGQWGMRTPSITWMTPLEAAMFVLITRTAPTVTTPFFTRTLRDCPLSVLRS